MSSKTANATATAEKPNAANTPAANAPEKEKAKPGSSITAQAKTLVTAVYTELVERLAELNKTITPPITLVDLLGEGIAENLTNLAGRIADTSQRGLPLSVRLSNVQAEIAEHWTSLPIKDGKAAPDAVWQEKANSLMVKKANIERAIKKAKADEKAKADAAAAGTTNPPPTDTGAQPAK